MNSSTSSSFESIRNDSSIRHRITRRALLYFISMLFRPQGCLLNHDVSDDDIRVAPPRRAHRRAAEAHLGQRLQSVEKEIGLADDPIDCAADTPRGMRGSRLEPGLAARAGRTVGPKSSGPADPGHLRHVAEALLSLFPFADSSARCTWPSLDKLQEIAIREYILRKPRPHIKTIMTGLITRGSPSPASPCSPSPDSSVSTNCLPDIWSHSKS